MLTDRHALDFRPAVQFRRLLERERPAIVQTHGYRPTTLAVLAGIPARRWKWIGFHHGRTNEGPKVRMYHRIDLKLLPASDQVVVVARSQRSLFSEAVPVTVIQNAVLSDTAAQGADRGAPSPLESISTLPRPWVGVVGRLSPEKGVDIFLQSCRHLLNEGVPITAVIAGDGPERQALEELARALGLSQVRFLGHVRDVGALYRVLDLVVLPSRSEGLPNTLLEAINAGCRSVATDVGAVAEVLEDPLLGLVVPPDAPVELAAAIRRLLASDATEASRLARTRVLDRYSLSARVAAHEELYRRLLVEMPG